MKPSLSATQQAIYLINEPYEEIDESGLFFDPTPEQEEAGITRPVQSSELTQPAFPNSPQLKRGITVKNKPKVSPGPGPKGLSQEATTAYRKLEKYVKDRYGLQLVLVSGFRSIEEQERLYNLYITKQSDLPAAPPGHSMHNFALAFDVNAKDARGTLYTSNNPDILEKIGLAGERLGLKWGGRFDDPVHFHLSGYNLEQLRRKHGIQ